jgi:uncharacterized membrane protein (DUF441 family)
LIARVHTANSSDMTAAVIAIVAAWLAVGGITLLRRRGALAADAM